MGSASSTRKRARHGASCDFLAVRPPDPVCGRRPLNRSGVRRLWRLRRPASLPRGETPAGGVFRRPAAHLFLTHGPGRHRVSCRVWQVLQDIPYGTAISYRELADRVGSPRAFQAVGQANGRNPLPILIPCHRVIASNGTLGGYSGGVERKRYLLQREGVSVPEPKPRKPRRKREVGAH